MLQFHTLFTLASFSTGACAPNFSLPFYLRCWFQLPSPSCHLHPLSMTHYGGCFSPPKSPAVASLCLRGPAYSHLFQNNELQRKTIVLKQKFPIPTILEIYYHKMFLSTIDTTQVVLELQTVIFCSCDGIHQCLVKTSPIRRVRSCINIQGTICRTGLVLNPPEFPSAAAIQLQCYTFSPQSWCQR